MAARAHGYRGQLVQGELSRNGFLLRRRRLQTFFCKAFPSARQFAPTGRVSDPRCGSHKDLFALVELNHRALDESGHRTGAIAHGLVSDRGDQKVRAATVARLDGSFWNFEVVAVPVTAAI